MFGTPRPTPLDLDFTLFGVPVRVSAWSWLVDLYFAYSLVRLFGPAGAQGTELAVHMAMATLCIFFSILLHEMGHAMAARWYGMERAILLLPLGGVAYGPGRPGVKWWQHGLISFAGPLAQLAFAAVLLGGYFGAEALNGGPVPSTPLAVTMLRCLLCVNVVWPLFNLRPVFPLDGGQILRVTLNRFLRRGDLWTGRVGLLFAVALACLFGVGGQVYMTLLFAFLAVQCYQLMRAGGIRGY